MSKKKNDDKKRIAEEERLLRRLQKLIYNNYLIALGNPFVKKAIKEEKDNFFFVHNDSANKIVEKQLREMAKQMDAVLLSGVERSWKQGKENFNDKMQLQFSKDARYRKELDKVREEATSSHREKTAQSFYKENRDGLNVSKRVWNLAGNAKKELEIIIQNGIKEGKSAQDISKSIREYLNEPEKLFRRVKNKETDKLEYSQAAQKYKPGRGVYRSAYKNAIRLARTEINAAYRQAEWESYQNNPLITGFRIALSNNHTCLKNGEPVPFHDICDELIGSYPKSFKWTGWHPQCRCVMIPIMITQDEFAERVEARANGTLDQWQSKSVSKPPKAFDEWVEKNRERAKGWANMPRFVRDNSKFVNDFEVDSYSNQEKKFTQARNTKHAMERVLKALKNMYPDVPNTHLAAIHHYTKSGGNYRQLNKQLFKETLTDFNKASSSLISKGLAELPAVYGSVYRGTIIKRKDFEAIYSGNAVTHKIFTSASSDIDSAIDFATYRNLKKNEMQLVFEIQSKNGKDISQISEFNGIFDAKNQKEVLFDKNTKFEIQSKHIDSSGTCWIKLNEK